jgi:lipoate-protein ligase B
MRKWSCCGRGILTIKSYYKRNNKNYKTRHVCIGRTSRSSSTISSSTPLGCYVHSGLSAGLIPYIRGHAWQTGLLHQYLSSSSSCDRLLLFQHEPVYTLGRGADEHHLLFLTNPKTNDLPHEEEAQQNILTLLCRSNKSSPAHLSFSSNHTIHIKSLSIPSDVHNNGKLLYDEMDIGEEEEGRGSQLPTRRNAYAGPVVKAPNGAAIYRVERGGQVTFHGPGMLVVYPLLDLRRYKQDLHWYLRQIEQVIIEVLKLYHISAYRDEPDTGKAVK